MATKKTKTGKPASSAGKASAAKTGSTAKKTSAPKRTSTAKQTTTATRSSSGETAAAKRSSKPSASSPAEAPEKATAKKKVAEKKTPAAKPAGVAKAAPETAKPARSRKAPAFSIGDKVVHPQHGAAIITKKTKQEVAGVKQDYFVLEIATDQLTVFVPVASIEETIRPVISQNQARKVFAIFKEAPQEAGSNWSRWYKVLNEKMTSGDIYQVAEVVRDLTYAQQTKGISPALKRMLSKARLTLISELSFALNIDDEEATRKLDRALPKVEAPEAV